MGQLHTLLDVDYDRARLVSLLDGGADADEVDDATGEPLLFTAARRRRLDAVEILLERGADPNRPDRNGKTPWAHAVRRGSALRRSTTRSRWTSSREPGRASSCRRR